ncbi:BPSS1780 family membrane protein [Marinagarivorans cellulosilyticus]|uniref:Transmembrane protein n=1 Tax=Marinagarivorans cellulosilyticus TaxID=2721545 RepID=A0AAN1WLN6_9GAMM|nr:BPSS1780 family membrane protein [Marinagarivorans cellulosilyticus]BCD99879.1 hypothetical protein MARGE09_P4081 [Marinagarivorans cellulosilyticus]
MSEAENPYQAPEADLNTTDNKSGEFVVHEAQTVGAGRGAGWLFDGFGYFKGNAGSWIGVCIIGFVLMIILSIIPVVNFVAGILGSVWVGGIMIGCKSIHDNQGLEVGHLFAGFKNKFGSLLGLSAILLFVSLGVMVLAMGSLFMAAMSGDTTAIAEEGAMKMALGVLVALALMIPLYMAVWFAPCLILFGDKGVFTAMKMSFLGCLKNIIPFFIYGIVMMVLVVLASIPLGLGLLIVGPMIFASMFIGFKEVYVD